MLHRSRLFRLPLAVGLSALAALTALSMLGELHWLAELLTHFRVQLATGALALATLAAASRSPWGGALALGLLVTNAVPVLASLQPIDDHGSGIAERREPLRVAVANVLTRNRAHEGLVDFVRREDPDIVGLLEVDRHWITSLRPLRESHPHGVEHPLSNNFGIAIYSRIPLDHVELRPLGHPDLMAIVAALQFEDEPLVLALAHPISPLSGGNARLRNQQLERLGELPHEFPESEFVLLSDLNTTPWSPYYERLEDASGLRNAARGHGYRPTWRVDTLPLALPIDHGLLSKGLRSRSFRVGPDIGSDHRPLVIDIVRH